MMFTYIIPTTPSGNKKLQKRNGNLTGKTKSHSLPFLGMNHEPKLSESPSVNHTSQPPLSNSPNPAPAAPATASSTISIDSFLNLVKLKTAKVVNAEDIPGKDKLYKLTLEVGSETRTLVAGIKQWYSKEELVGKTIAIVANLEPKKLGGIVSEGMLLAALDDEGKFSLLVAEKPVKSGAEVR